MEMVMGTETAEYTFQTALPFTQTPTIASRDDSNDEVYFGTKPLSDKLLLWNTYGSMELSIVGGTADLKEMRESFYMQKGIVLTPRVKSEAEPFLRKVGAFVMPMGTPTFVELYAEEMKESADKPLYKTIYAGTIALIVTLLGIKLASLVFGLIVVAVLDLILGLLPGNVKKGTEKDHTIQAKFMGLVTNMIGIIAVTKGMEYLINFSDVAVLSKYVMPYLPYVVSGWAFSVYFSRIVKYMARANRTKVPKVLTDIFNRKGPSA
ncbi:hypothetical protein ACIOBL_01615 [Paenibacillus taichungensis]|uniref:hypothetical protein n=1 Tax=Paenibacillus taichungensis TaxID=484184 RepID=UPI00380EEFD3